MEKVNRDNKSDTQHTSISYDVNAMATTFLPHRGLIYGPMETEILYQI
jgi:hypothetical protein